jgi:hypothetical protein
MRLATCIAICPHVQPELWRFTMTMLSTTAWVVHDLGLASAFGGSLFGKLALEPAVGEVSDEKERVRVEDRAWKRFSLWNTIGLAAAGITWFAGRGMLSGKEASGAARGLTIAKDALVGTSLGVGVAAAVIGRLVARAKEQQQDQVQIGAEVITEPTMRMTGVTEADQGLARYADRLERTVDILGSVQLGLTAGILAVTSALAMESSKSVKFAARSRWLP